MKYEREEPFTAEDWRPVHSTSIPHRQFRSYARRTEGAMLLSDRMHFPLRAHDRRFGNQKIGYCDTHRFVSRCNVSRLFKRLIRWACDGAAFSSLPFLCIYTHTRNGKFRVHGFCETEACEVWIVHRPVLGGRPAADSCSVAKARVFGTGFIPDSGLSAKNNQPFSSARLKFRTGCRRPFRYWGVTSG